MESRPSQSNPTIRELIRQWQEAQDQGNPLTPEQLCRDHPELLSSLKEQLAKASAPASLNTTKDDTALPDSKADTPAHLPKDARNLPDRIGSYQLLNEISQGGMGVVYQVWDESLERELALKMIRGDRDAHPELITRFIVEARALARLNHRHIVTVHDFGVIDQCPYYTMDLARGGNLTRSLARLRQNLVRAIHMVAQITRAVHYAHENGVLHRDLKPANILLDEQGEPLVSDFGLARLVDLDLNLTSSGQMVGTPSYMAPEQARGEPDQIAPWTDVWALGVILYEIVIGERPFQGQTREQILHRIASGALTPASEKKSSAHPQLARVIDRCLQLNVHDRFQSCQELAEQLESCLRRNQIYRPSIRAASLLKRPSFVMVTSMLLLLSLTFLLASDEQEESGPQPRILIGAHGKMHSDPFWLSGQSPEKSFRQSQKDGSLLVCATEEAHLMLLKRAPWPHYRIEAELCHLEGPRGKVGLCFFHQLARPPSRVQGYFKLHFTDQMHGLSLVMAEIVAHIPGEGTRELDLGMHLLNSRPRRGRLPIRWRRVNIEVRNNSVMIEWENLRFLLKRSQLIASWNAACPLKRIRPSLNLQGGIGLHVSKGKASFRNVRIVPLSTD